MSEFSDYLEDKILDITLKGGTAFNVADTHLAVYTVVPTDAGGGTECSYSGYARQPITWGTVSGGSVASGAEVSFPPVLGTAITAVAIGVFDSATPAGSNLLYWTLLAASKDLSVNDVLNIASGDLTVTLD